MQRIEILIFSYDGAEDIWPIFFKYFFNVWPDCPYRINLLTNYKKFDDPRVNSLCIGEDKGWSTNAIVAVKSLNSPYILSVFDDFIFYKNLNVKQIDYFVNLAMSKNFDFFRLRPSPKPDYKINNLYGRLDQESIYRISLTNCIVKSSTLLKILVPEENAWQYEHEGSIRSNDIYHVYGTYQNYMPYINALEKGQWTHWAVDFFKKNLSNSPDYSKRGFYKFKWTDRISWIQKIKLFIINDLFGIKGRKYIFNFLIKIKK